MFKVGKCTKVLFIAQLLPYPPVSGGQIKNWATLQHLSARYRVSLISFIRSDAERTHLKLLSQICENVHLVQIDRARRHDVLALTRSIVTGIPFVIVRDCRSEMHSVVQRFLADKGVDIIHVDQLNMAQYAPLGPWRRVLDQQNVVSSLVARMASDARNPLFRWLFKREAAITPRYEGEICRKFDAVITVTNSDREKLVSLAGPDAWIVTIPIGVDPLPITVPRPSTKSHILILGTMSYKPNSDGALWFADQVLTEVLRLAGDTRVSIVGSRPPIAVRRIATQFPGVEVTGFVDDLTPYFEQATVMAVPLLVGGGMRVKILEAFAHGIPVVSTSVGAEGIDAVPGRDLLIADDPEAFAKALVRILHDADLANELAANGRQLLASNYNRASSLAKYDRLYEGMWRS